jgi:hypothetical protein
VANLADELEVVEVGGDHEPVLAHLRREGVDAKRLLEVVEDGEGVLEARALEEEVHMRRIASRPHATFGAMADPEEEQALSIREIERMGADVILGPQLVAVYLNHLTNGRDLYPARFLHLLLGAEANEDEPAVEPLVDVALAAARHDPDFLKVRVSDLETLHGDRVRRDDADLLHALARHLGLLDRTYQYAYWPAKDHNEYSMQSWRDLSGTLAGHFKSALVESETSWLELARSKDSGVSSYVQKRIGDPHEPEQLVKKLLERRLWRLADELSFVHAEHLAELERQRTLAAEQEDERAIEDAWSGFLTAPAPESAPVRTPAVAKQQHPRGVAESLGDREL